MTTAQQVIYAIRAIAPCSRSAWTPKAVNESASIIQQAITEAVDAVVAQERERIPKGWKLVPEVVTLEMQHAYFKVIDANMPRLENHRDTFGRYDANRAAYSAMIKAAPESPKEK